MGPTINFNKMKLPVFFVGMFLASAFSFSKVGLLAVILSSHDYGIYVSLIGISAILGIFSSFGVVEDSYKKYPLLWVAGRRSEILNEFLLSTVILVLRLVVMFLFSFLFVLFDFLEISFLSLAFIFCAAIVSVLFSLFASVCRAFDSTDLLLRYSFYRAAVVFFISIFMGFWVGGWGALFGDFLGNFLILAFGYFHLLRVLRSENFEFQSGKFKQLVCGVFGVAKARNGINTYFSNIAGSSVIYLDKGIVAYFCGAGVAGLYAVVMLVSQIGQIAVNILVQKFAPIFVKRVYQNKDIFGGRRELFGYLAYAIFVILLSLAYYSFRGAKFAEYFFVKYPISDLSLLLVSVLAICQIYSIIEFKLIALSCERFVLYASLTAAAVFYLMCIVPFFKEFSIDYFLFAVLLSKVVQMVMLILFLKNNSPSLAEISK